MSYKTISFTEWNSFISLQKRFGNMLFPNLLLVGFENKLFLFIDIAIRKCYNACEKTWKI